MVTHSLRQMLSIMLKNLDCLKHVLLYIQQQKYCIVSVIILQRRCDNYAAKSCTIKTKKKNNEIGYAFRKNNLFSLIFHCFFSY